MGKSITINCLGYAPINENESKIFTAMNKREMAWEKIKAEKQGLKIGYWQAQTKTGEKMLGRFAEKDIKIKYPKMVQCICRGRGYYTENGKQYHCPVCNGSGQTIKGYWNKWQDWQIEMFQK